MSTVSYAIRITNEYRIFDQTCKLYADAVWYLVHVCDAYYKQIRKFQYSKERMNFIEKKIHSTKGRKAKHDFDKRFYKFPSYLRRSAITEAIGIVMSYRSNYQNWLDNGKVGKAPSIGKPKRLTPCLYNQNMFKESDGKFYVKIYRNNDWVWHGITLRKGDFDSVQKRITLKSAPVLEKHNKRYYLRFTENVISEKKFVLDVNVKRVVGVDLGLINDAVCSVVEKDGTVTGRTFINSPIEKDRLSHLLGKIKASQSQGNLKTPRLWRFVNNYQGAIERETARRIVLFAREHNADVIVFESLKNFHPKFVTQRVHLWRKRAIQRRVEEMAARFGIRVSYVNAKNTSLLAFDGSGKVKRDTKNRSIGTFADGKNYNIDLSASYNIGARFFVRVYEKTTPAKTWSEISANVPELSSGTCVTLSTLISLNRALGSAA